MVFFGKRADAVKGKDGAANQKKKGLGFGRQKKSEVIPADDKWTLDFKKEYLDGLKKQAEESSRILEREKAELAERISHHKSHHGHAQPSSKHSDPSRSPHHHHHHQPDASPGRGGGGGGGGKGPPKIHVPNPSGDYPDAALDHGAGGGRADVKVYDPSEIPGLGARAENPNGNGANKAARGGGGARSKEDRDGARGARAEKHQGGRHQRPSAVVVGSGSPGKDERRRGGGGGRRDEERGGHHDRHREPDAGGRGGGDPYNAPQQQQQQQQQMMMMQGDGQHPHYEGSPPPPAPYDYYYEAGYGPYGGSPPPPGAAYSPTGPPPPMMQQQQQPPYDPYGPPSPGAMQMPPYQQGYAPPPPLHYGGPPPPPYGYQGNGPPPDYYGGGYDYAAAKGNGPPPDYYGGGYDYQQPPPPHPNWQQQQQQMPMYPPGEVLSPGAQRRHGIANMYGEEDTMERRQKEDARSAYARDLDEQIRQKQEAKEAEKRAAADFEAKKEAEIERLVREERAQQQQQQQHHHHHQHQEDHSHNNGNVGAPRRRHQQGHPSDSVLGGGGGQISPSARPPPKAAAAAALSPHPPAGPPDDDPGRRRQQQPQGRRVVSELRAGPSEAQQAKAAAQREELRVEWERQAAEKKAAAERKKAEEREQERLEEAEIRAYHAKLQAEREEEERARFRPTEQQQQLPDPFVPEHRAPPRHGRRGGGSPTTDMMMDALGEAHSALAEAGVHGAGAQEDEEEAMRMMGGILEAPGAAHGRRPNQQQQHGGPRVYSRTEIPGLGGDPSPTTHQEPFLRSQAWPEDPEEAPKPAKATVVVGARAQQQQRRPRGGRGEAEGPGEGATAVVGAEVSSLLKELRDEQSALREHVEKHTEAMTALQSQAKAERERAKAELSAVRSRMQPQSGGGGEEGFGDSLDQFVVETHILPKHINSIPEDLRMLPAMDNHHGHRGATPELPNTSSRHRVPDRHARDRGISSPAIIRGDLGDIQKGSGAPGRLGSKLGGPPPAQQNARQRRAKTEKKGVEKKQPAGASRWK